MEIKINLDKGYLTFEIINQYLMINYFDEKRITNLLHFTKNSNEIPFFNIKHFKEIENTYLIIVTNYGRLIININHSGELQINKLFDDIENQLSEFILLKVKLISENHIEILEAIENLFNYYKNQEKLNLEF